MAVPNITVVKVGFRGLPGAGMTALDRAELHALSEDMTGVQSALADVLARLAALEAGTGPVNPTEPVDPKTHGWRTALTGASVIGPSGHSLSNAAFKNQGNLQIIRNSLYDPDDWGDEKVLFNTGPYASIKYRWDTDLRTIGDSKVWFRLPEDMRRLDSFILTEAGPFARIDIPGDKQLLLDTLDYGLRFYDVAVTEGVGDLVWHTINAWPNGFTPWGAAGGFKALMAEYERTTHYLVGYWEWKLKQLHPTLPAGFRIAIIPFGRFWSKIDDDVRAGLVPGISSILQLFRDGASEGGEANIIHPNAIGDYAASVLAEAMLYKDNPLRFETYVHGTGQGDPLYQPVTAGKWPVPASVDPALAAYFFRTAMEVLLDYEPAGMGGTDRGAATWFDPANGDPLNPTGPVDPTDPVDTTPQNFLLQFDGANYTGPALTGDPIATGTGHVVLDGAVRTLQQAMPQGYYAIYALEPGASVSGENGTVVMITPDQPGWGKPQAMNRLNAGDGNSQVYAMSHLDGAQWPEGVNLGRVNHSEWSVVQVMSVGDQQGGQINGGAFMSETNPSGAMTATNFLRLFDAVTGKLAFLRVYDYLPSEAERAALLALAQRKVLA